MSSPDLLIRPARPGEAVRLTALCVRAKAHWGYDRAFMAAAAEALRIRERAIGLGNVLVASASEATVEPLGVATVEALRRPGWFELNHLFVAPECFGRGIGRALFQASAALARQRGGTHLSILSDPHAAAFYERIGARLRGEAPSDAIPGRMLPLFDYVIGPG
jgi:predicted N-acetyltransferase YhbS